MDVLYAFFFFFKQKTAYEMRISDWSSGVCSSDLDRKLDRALEADVGVDAVVVDAGQHQMLLVDGAAEPFDAVVRAVVDLDIVDGRAGADARQSDAVQLIARRNLEARIETLHVAAAAALFVGRGADRKDSV